MNRSYVRNTPGTMLKDDDVRKIVDEAREAIALIGARNASEDPETVYREVTEIVEQVRQERHEQERRTQDHR